MNQETFYAMALTRLTNFNFQQALEIYKAAGSAQNLYEHRNEVGDMIEGCTPRLVEALKDWGDAMKRAEAEVKYMEEHKIRACTLLDDDYPQRLLECADAPLVLYYKGNSDLNQTRIISMVGTRQITNYGRDLCHKFIRELHELCPQVLIVSGLAYGVDICAHRHALKQGYDTVGVLAHGLDQIYPYAHRATAIEMLKQGDNTWGITLGNGFFNPVPMPIFRPLREYLTIGRPMVIGQLEITYADGSLEKVQTDLSWKTTPGPIMRNNPYLGEHYDARAEVPGWNEPGISTQNWKSVALAEPPTGQLKPQMQPPIRATAILKPVRMTETRPGEFVYDMGQNFAGVVRLKVKGPAGTKITVRYGEDVYSDGSLNVMTTVAGQHKQVWDANRSVEGAPPTAWQEDTYILKGEGEEIWQPRFTFHGFQYIEITGFPGRPTLDNVEGIRLSADLEKVGEFECSDDVVNKIERAVEWTFLSNVFSVQSDCPGREKLGYGGDIAATTDAFCYLFDMHNFYSKTVYDHRDAARPSGAMTETAPYMGIADAGFGDGSGPIGWQLGFAVALKKIHDYYGDIRIVADNYDTLKKQIEFLRAHAQENIISNCISDHEMIENPRPAALTATGHYYNHVIILAEFARLLGKTEDARTYEQLANEIKAAFIAKFYKPGGIYDSNLQTTQAFALHYDLIPDGKRGEVLKQLLNVLDRDGNHIHTGIFATPMLLNQLSENGYSDRAFRLVSNRDYPGWGHMITSGATTIWETWKYSDNIYSHNHPMFGSVNEWFYRALLGINTETPGFETVRISPKTVKGLTWAKGSYRSVKGRISVDWKKNENQLLLNVTIPTGMKAHIYVPHAKGQTIYEGDAKADSVKDIFYRGESGGTSVYDVSGGSYRFTVK